MNQVELVKWTPPRAQDVSRGAAEEKLDDVSAVTNKEESDEMRRKTLMIPPMLQYQVFYP